jgi:hypothetical protein
MFWQGVGKEDRWISNSLMWGVNGNSQWQSSGFVQQLDYWRPDNTDAYYARPLMISGAKNHQVQTRYLLNAAYLRLKSLQLGYTIPEKILDKFFVHQFHVFVSGENLLTVTKMPKQFDPETENNGLAYPLQKVISLGLNVTF